MKKIIIASAIVLLAVVSNAQVSKIQSGKKLQMLSETKVNTTVSVMGQEMEVPATTKTSIDVDVKSVNGNTVTSTITTKKITGTVTMMGQSSSFDSDDKSIMSNPQAAEALKNLNKPEEIIIENGKIKGKYEIGTTGAFTSSEVAKKMFLSVDAANIKEGFKWEEENVSEGSKSNTIYTITKVTADEIEVTAASNVKIDKTVNQMGMDMKQNITGTTTSVSLYNAATSTLKADATKMDWSGTLQVMGNDAPMSIKIVTTSTVK